MKLKNKLFPILGAVATTATILPLSTLTSCKKSTDENMTTYDFKTDGYTPTVDPVYAVLNTETASTAYYHSNQTDTSVFKNDILMAQYRDFTERKDRGQQEHASYTLSKYSVSITEPVIGLTYISYPGTYTSTPYPTATFTMKIEINEEYEEAHEDTRICYEKVSTRTQKFTNVPFYVSTDALSPRKKGNADSSAWSVGVVHNSAWEWMFGYMNDEWKIEDDRTSTETSWTKGIEEYKTVRKEHIPHTFKSYTDLANFDDENGDIQDVTFNFDSYYLSDCDMEDEIIENRLISEASSPWNDTTSKKNPKMTISGLYFSDGKAVKKTNWKLNQDLKLKALYEVDQGTDCKYVNKNYYLYVPKNTKLSVDEYGYISFEGTVHSDYDSSEQDVSIFEKDDCGDIVYFKLPKSISVINDTDPNDPESLTIWPDSTQIPLTIKGTMAITNVAVANAPTSGTWDGLLNITFTYDAPVDPKALSVNKAHSPINKAEGISENTITGKCTDSAGKIVNKEQILTAFNLAAPVTTVGTNAYLLQIASNATFTQWEQGANAITVNNTFDPDDSVVKNYFYIADLSRKGLGKVLDYKVIMPKDGFTFTIPAAA